MDSNNSQPYDRRQRLSQFQVSPAVNMKTPSKAKVRMSKPRLTGLEGDDERDEKTAAGGKNQPERGDKGVTQQSPTGTNAVPLNYESPLTRILSATDKFHAQSRTVQSKRKTAEVMFSDNFMDSLCGSSEGASTALNKKPKIIRKKLSATFKNGPKRDSVEEGKAVVPFAATSGGVEKKRVRFSDEFGIELTQTRFFEVEEGERVNVFKMNLSREEIKHFDSQQEKIMFQQHHQFGAFSLTDPALMPPGHLQRPMPQDPVQQQHNLYRPGMAPTVATPFPPSATMMRASSSGAQMGKFGKGMQSFFRWKLSPIDDAIALIESGNKSQSKNVEAARIRGVMEAICLPEINLPISDIDETEHKKHQKETLDHVSKIIPHEMINENIVPSAQVEPQQQKKLEVVEEPKRREPWEEMEEDEDRYSPEPPAFKRFDEVDEKEIVALVNNSKGSSIAQQWQNKAKKGLEEEEEEEEEEDNDFVMTIEDDDQSPEKAKTIPLTSSPTTMEHGPASPEPEQMDESTDSIQLLKQIPTEAMDTDDMDEEEEDLDIRILQYIPATGSGTASAAEVQSVAQLSPAATVNDQKDVAGVDDLRKVQAFLRKGGGLNSSLLQRISSMVGSGTVAAGTQRQPPAAEDVDSLGEASKVCLSAPVTPSKEVVVDHFGGKMSLSSSSMNLPSSISSCPSSSVAATASHPRFLSPIRPMHPIMRPIGAFPLPDFSKPPPNFITTPPQIRPAVHNQIRVQTPQQTSTSESPTVTQSSEKSSPTIASTPSEGKATTSPGPPGLDEGGSPPQAPTEQQQQEQHQQQKELHPLLDKEEARALVGPCQFFLRHNTCKFGDRCKFAHGEDSVTFGVQMAMRGVRVAVRGGGGARGGRGAFVGRRGGFGSIAGDRSNEEAGNSEQQNGDENRPRRRGTSGRYISPIRSSASASRFDRRYQRSSPDRNRRRRRSRTRSRSRDRYSRRRRSRDRRRRSRSRDRSYSRDRSRSRDHSHSKDRGKTRASSSSSSSSSSTRTYSSRSATPPANSS